MRKLNVMDGWTDGQTDRRTDGRTGVAISPVPGPTAPAGDKKQAKLEAPLRKGKGLQVDRL